MAAGRSSLKDDRLERQLFRARVLQSLVVVALALVLLLARYAWLQLVQHDDFATRSDNNRIKLLPVAPARGLIYDRHGVVLADNRPAFRIELIPEQIQDLDATLSGLASVIDLGAEDLDRFREQYRASRRFRSVPLKLRLDEHELARFAVDRHRFPGAEIAAYQSRHYRHGALYAHLIGYVGRIDADDRERLDLARYAGSTHVGKTGLERRYEDLLLGAVGFEQVETNAAGRPLRVVARVPPGSGQHLHLSIDHRLQLAMAEAFGGEPGAAIAIDPRNGEVLAMVSLPSFDPNPFVGGIGRHAYAELVQSPDRPLFNRVVQGGYEPGSTLKPLFALAAMELGLRTPGASVVSTGSFQLPGHGQTWRDWRPGGHGRVDAREAIAQSVNTYFYQLAVDVGIERMAEYLAPFGFGQPTGLDLIGEARGVLPTPAWKRATLNEPWYLGETVIAGIGQGYWVATLPQLAQGIAILARHGDKAPLHLLRAVQSGLNEAPTPYGTGPVERLPVRDRAHWQAAIDGMVAVIHGPTGTARAIAAGAEYTMAGKTGTAQRVSRRELRPGEEVARHLRHQALFVGFAPADDPRIVVVVVVEGGGSGSRAAAPVARQILDAWWRIDGRPS